MPRSGPSGGGNKDDDLRAMSFDNLTIADFEDDNDVGYGDISDLESVADLPDEPSNTSHTVHSSSSASASSSFRSSRFTVNVSKPSATRAVYSVPTVVNFQDWEASRSWDDDDDKTPNQGKGASAVPMLTRLLILKNVDVCSHCAVISAPLTERFGLVARHGGSGAKAGIGGMKAPFKLVLEPGASCTFDVLFFRPDDEELKFWDNFRDAIVIYTERYSITVPFRALRTGRDCAPSSFTPSIEAMTLPQKPEETQFSAMLSGREAEVKVIPGPAGLGSTAAPREAASTAKAGKRAEAQVSTARTVRQEENKRHVLTDSEEEEPSSFPSQDREHDVASMTGSGSSALTHERRRNSGVVVATERDRHASSPPAKVLDVNPDDAAALILQMRRKLQQTAPQPGKFGGPVSPTRGQRRSPTVSATVSPSGSGSALAATTNSAESIRRFQEEALSSRHTRSASDDEQEFYRSLMRRDVTGKTAAGSTAPGPTPNRGLAIARGGSLTAKSHRGSRTDPTQVGHQRVKTPGPQSKQSATAGHAGRSETGALAGRGGEALIEHSHSSPRRRDTAAAAAPSRGISSSAASSKLRRHRTEPNARRKRPTVQHAVDEVDFYRSLIQKQNAPVAKQLPPRAFESRIRPQSQQQDANARIGRDTAEVPEEWVAEYNRRLAAAKSSSPTLGEREHAGSSPIALSERSTVRDGQKPKLNALRHPYGGSRKQKPTVISSTIRRQREERTTAYRPGQRITVRAPVRRRHAS